MADDIQVEWREPRPGDKYLGISASGKNNNQFYIFRPDLKNGTVVDGFTSTAGGSDGRVISVNREAGRNRWVIVSEETT